MTTLYTYGKQINDDSVFVSIYSEEVEELATAVQDSLENQIGQSRLGVLGMVEVEARDIAREELARQGFSTSPKYHKPITEFYSGLIKDELLRRVF